MPKVTRQEDLFASLLPRTLPLMALRSTIVFPYGTIAVQMGAPENITLLDENPDQGLMVALVVATGEAEDPLDTEAVVNRIGVAARVHERINLPGHTVQITLQGVQRILIEGVQQTEPYPVAIVRDAQETPVDATDGRTLITQVITAAETLADLAEKVSADVPSILRMNVADPGRFADLAATNLGFRIADRDEVLQRLDVGQRLRFVLTRLEREVARARVMEDVKKQTEVKIDEHQREFYLRQQLRAIQSELGEADPNEKDALELLTRVEEAGLPEKALVEAKREIERLRMLSPASSEYQVVRTYLDWLLALPWSADSGHHEIELAKVQGALDARHYGLDEAKERILEFLAVRKLRNGASQGPILCFVGPPGTGKTSLGEAIGAAIGRPCYRISVGGVRDEAEIRGHRRTYVGAMPGLLLQALRRVQVNDPILMIDEIDKMSGGGPSGDPAAAMLEVLDPMQNKTFTDHYLNLSFDLSSVLFICTANNLFDIPGPLRDRMEVIKIAGYTVEEKVEIAWRYLLPRLLADHGLTETDIQFTDESLTFISNRYSREAGLRNFERNLAAILRKRARRKAEGEEARALAAPPEGEAAPESGTGADAVDTAPSDATVAPPPVEPAWVIDEARVEALLGVPHYVPEAAEQAPEVGVVTGLAWTASGGDLIVIEALRMPGTGRLTVTGQLGDVMRESVDAAHSYVRSRASQLAIDDATFKEHDLHIHLPAGAIPKDGPSAGITITLAIASVLSQRPVRRDLAMTGEVTLRGKVLEIGGVKEKVLAAYRSGLREVILPKANEKDMRDVPPEVREHMAFVFVERMDQVLQHALLDQQGKRARPPRRRASDDNADHADPAHEAPPASGEPMAADSP